MAEFATTETMKPHMSLVEDPAKLCLVFDHILCLSLSFTSTTKKTRAAVRSYRRTRDSPTSQIFLTRSKMESL